MIGVGDARMFKAAMNNRQLFMETAKRMGI